MLLLCVAAPLAAAEAPRVLLPRQHLQPEELAVLVNDRDPLSRRIGRYYVERRGIPERNLVHLSFPPDKPVLSPERFAPLRQRMLERIGPQVQALALTWVTPYRVGCMSITTAFAAGFDPAWCSARTCAPTRRSAYFDSRSTLPRDDHGLLPAMSIAALDFEQARALIERGIAADGSFPRGAAYLLETHDRNRSVRARRFPLVEKLFGDLLDIRILKRNSIRDRDDIMFYFTGLKQVPHLDTLDFLPGAVADHLTSAGGALTGKSQMSALRWLEAGATGSYGTVVEPCNLLGKFPDPATLMVHYLTGNSLIETYWKSVAMPGEGIFIGEPLAAPFAGYRLETTDDGLRLTTHALAPGRYRIEAAPALAGPFSPTPATILVRQAGRAIDLPHLDAAVIRFRRLSQR